MLCVIWYVFSHGHEHNHYTHGCQDPKVKSNWLLFLFIILFFYFFFISYFCISIIWHRSCCISGVLILGCSVFFNPIPLNGKDAFDIPVHTGLCYAILLIWYIIWNWFYICSVYTKLIHFLLLLLRALIYTTSQKYKRSRP